MIFSKNPEIAEQQMVAIIVYCTTFGYIDGDFDLSEKVFVLEYIRSLTELRVQETGVTDEHVAMEMVARYKGHYDRVFEHVDHQIRGLFDEVVADNEDMHRFVYAKLKLQCFELFKQFDPENQRRLLAVANGLINADGQAHPNEVKFREELQALLTAATPVELSWGDLEQVKEVPPQVAPPVAPRPAMDNHPILELQERHYSRDPGKLQQQVQGDWELIRQTLALWEEQRRFGNGKLSGQRTVGDLAGTGEFLDRHVYSVMPRAGQDYELVVFGDLHGCYSCLKGGLLQVDFFRKVSNYRRDPRNNPNIKLIFLGDYIDRGVFSFNGILRTVMQLFVSMPEHVYVLRGNHEYYLNMSGRVMGGVRPAEAIATMEPYVPPQVLEAYMTLFESMPNMLLFDRTLFVHAGIPRDELVAERWRDLSSLNDHDIRFQMMWSDPANTPYIPAELQRENARFPFGKQQFRAFMNRIGCNTMVRGHEKVDEGFRKIYDEPDMLLLNLFSAGGAQNNDLPVNSSYRTVTPMALTMRWRDGKTTMTPFAIDWQDYQTGDRNQFFKTAPEIEFRHG
jgi:hypothetical protein